MFSVPVLQIRDPATSRRLQRQYHLAGDGIVIYRGTEDSSWPENYRMCKYFHLHASFDCSMNIYTFCIKSDAPRGSPVGVLFTCEQWKSWLMMY